MTTNFTAIINENLDMFDETETMSLAEEAMEVKNELQAREEEARELENFRAYERKVLAMSGNEEGYAEAMALYSDWHKDMYGYRPYGIGLRYHFIR